MPTIDLLNTFLVVVPGAMTVWSFRCYITNSDKKGDFEYLMLSVFWGVFILACLGSTVSKDELTKILGNPYASAECFSTIGILFGWFGGVISRAIWFKRAPSWLRTARFFG
jgi:hypothetical protein